MTPIIFTDLDGTLLNEDYSFREALPALKLIKTKKIPLIFCTSKTVPETKIYIRKIGINQPFIVENGGAILIPKNYFDFKFHYDKIKDDYFVIELGTDYKKLMDAFNKLKKVCKFKIIDFSDMDAKIIAHDTGLNLNEAKLAKKRNYSIPFKIEKNNFKKMITLIKKSKLNYTRGKSYHYIMGKNNKAKAVKILIKLYKQKYKEIFTIGLGNSFNDLSMLKMVNKAFLIKNKDGYDKDLKGIKKK